MNLKTVLNMELPLIWVAIVEIILAGFAIYSISIGSYIEALLCLVLIELREMNIRNRINRA